LFRVSGTLETWHSLGGLPATHSDIDDKNPLAAEFASACTFALCRYTSFNGRLHLADIQMRWITAELYVLSVTGKFEGFTAST
jgi:hypothetical protein